ncbi:MAG: isoprenyl transferase [Anaerosomatales bacterium]|nr:isoprenyl transferase [Anaerosomatales bacterium]
MTPSDTTRGEFFSARRDRELLERFDPASVPTHIAVIMDGNGRWAAKRGLPRIAGHRAGAKAVRETIAAALELGVGYLTIYSFSSENWRRPADEVSGLMTLFVEVLERELTNLERQGVRVKLIGSTEGVPQATLEAFRRTEDRTKALDRLTLLVALNYGGRGEIADAVRTIASDVASGVLDPAAVDEDLISDRLYTSGIPDPDLVIRTSGEMRVSNFLLWQIAYSEIWVTSTLWPDFRRGDLLRAVVDYQGRTRRFGGA